MRKFKLSVIMNDVDHTQNILLTHFENSNSPTLTFNEQLEENEHDNYTFSFSIVSKILQDFDDSFEPQIDLVKYLKMGRLLKLELEGKTDYIKFVIISITPEESSQNIVYNISCQDYASYMFSKTGIGIEINTIDDEDYYKSGMKSNLFQISNYILRKGGLQKINYPTLSEIEEAEDPSIVGFKDTVSISVAKNAESLIEYNGGIPGVNDVITKNEVNLTWSKKYKVEKDYIVHEYVNFHTYGIEYIVNPNIETRYLIIDVIFPNGDVRHIRAKPSNKLYYENIVEYHYDVKLYNVRFLKGIYGVDSVNTSQGVGLSLDLLSNANYNPLFPSMFLMEVNDIKFLMKNKFYLYKEFEEINDEGGTGEPTCISFVYNGETFICKDLSEWPYIYSIKAPKGFYRINDKMSWKISNINLLDKKINLDISNSNVYNALIELANLTETYLKFDYKNKIIDFIDRDSEINERNFYLSPEVNLSSLDLDYNIDEFCTMLYVSGADDEYGMDAGLVPSIPEEALKFFNIVNSSEYTGNLKFGKVASDNNSYYTRVLNENDGPIRWLDDLEGEIYEKNLKFAKIANNIPYLDNFILDLSYFIDMGLLNSSVGVMHYINNNLREININYQYWIRKKYEAEFEIFDIENKILNQCEILLDGSKDNYVEENKKLNKEFYSGEGKFPFFQNMVKYKGESFLIEKLNKYIEDSIEMIKERDIAIKDLTDLKTLLQDLKNAPESLENTNKIRNAEVDIAGKQKDVDMYKSYIGNWVYDEVLQEIVRGDSYGKYCHFIECFENNLELFNSNYQGAIIYDEYIKIKEKKEDFWFDFRYIYGQYLIEGFYENDSEFDPVKLYNQAKIYSKIHSQPVVDYNISYIDISDVIGKDLQKIQVGDIIKIPTKHLGILDKDSEIQVVSISSSLRNSSDIQLTVNRTDYKMIKKLLENLQK